MQVKRVYKPKNDDEFLEDLAMIVFVSGFRYDLVEERWPAIKKAFEGFSIKTISRYTDKDINKIMKAKRMIKNQGKISAIAENAKICMELQKEHGSVLKWIGKIKNNYDKNPLLSPSLEESFRRFERIGKITSGWLASLHNSKKNYLEYEI